MFGKKIICGHTEENIDVTLERFPKSECELLAGWVSDPETSKWIYIDCAFSKEQEESWYDDVTNKENKYIWGIYYGDKLVGVSSLIYVDSIKRNTEIGLMIGDKSVYKKGIGTLVVKGLVNYAFNELNLECIYYNAAVENKGSIACAKKNKFKEYGIQPHSLYRDGKYTNMWMSALIKK